jgi:hypothetical protein
VSEDCASLESKQAQRQRGQRLWVDGLLVSAQKRDWFGRITIEIKRGLIDVVKSEQSLKPPQ